MSEILRFENVSLSRNEIPILKNISFSMKEGQSVAIVGRNGAGKTTLINLLFGYLWPSSGTIFAFGEEYGTTPLAPLQQKIGFLQSAHQEQLVQKSLTAIEVVITGIHKTLGLYQDISTEAYQLALDRLHSVNLAAKANQRYSTLSSGEKTKILLLRALGDGVKLLVLDEPTAALDFTARYQLEKSIERLKIENTDLTRILITHRIEEIPSDFDTILLLKDGLLIGYGAKELVLTSANLSQLYDLPVEVHFANQRYFISGLL
ncbi:ATP-binding cassette domain-containing protein [Leptospira ognonensis]|uniref:ATP-binding cassette domain-containing protein n=1 Tax=Leptospira ognonensis TaxID=2484945 RepID=A0A4R9K3R9_9LEPT|nr:ATP-binding cassette domain-containing protein [Leptospira ognonensis]TGL60066.1 ATP-binding cassette domain-containing protein [Leptospira ognonensis]